MSWLISLLFHKEHKKADNMKKFANFSMLSLLLLLLTGCTLSMDEWVEKEEDKGYGEVETIENDYYTLNYEYKKNTRSLTEDIQKYIAQIEADSIFYFMDNIPSEWLPTAGGQVVANCCERFPMGYMGKVLSVEKANGLYKVVTTDATLQDCFEEFDFEFASAIETADPEDQVADTVAGVRQKFTRASADGKSEEVVIRDWTMFNKMKNAPKRRTRASFEEVFEKDMDDKSTKSNDVLILQINPGDAAGEAIKKFTKGFINTIDFNFYYTTKVVTHKKIELKKKREYTKTDQCSGLKVTATIGHDLVKGKLSGKSDKVKKELADNLWEALANSNSKFAQKLGSSVDNGYPSITLEIPLGTLPVGLIIRVKPVVDLSVGIYGSVEATFWLSRNVTTTDIVDGKKKVDKNEKKSPPKHDWDWNVYGSLSAAGGLEIFVGVGKKLLNGEAVAGGIRAQATVNLDVTLNPKALVNYISGNENDALKLSGKGEVGGAFLTGGWFGDIHFLTFPFTWWDGITFSYNPRVKMNCNYPYLEKTDDDGKKYYEQGVSYNFANLGMLSSFWASQYKPVVAIYANENDPLDKPITVLSPESFGSSEKVKTNKEYKFTYNNYTEKDVYAVPGLAERNASGNTYLYSRYKSELSSAHTPTIEYDLTYDHEARANDYVYQSYGKYITSTPDGDIYGYSFLLPFTLRDASYIDDYWDDWGVYYYIKCDKYAFSKSKYKSLKNSIQSSGKYLVNVKFNAGIDADSYPLTVESCIYYKPKGSSTSFKIYSPEAGLFQYERYKVNKSDVGDVLLKRNIPLGVFEQDKDFEKELWGSFKNMNVVVN